MSGIFRVRGQRADTILGICGSLASHLRALAEFAVDPIYATSGDR